MPADHAGSTGCRLGGPGTAFRTTITTPISLTLFAKRPRPVHILREISGTDAFREVGRENVIVAAHATREAPGLGQDLTAGAFLDRLRRDRHPTGAGSGETSSPVQ